MLYHNAVGRDPIERLRFLRRRAPACGREARKRNLSIGSIPVCLCIIFVDALYLIRVLILQLQVCPSAMI